MCHDVKHHFIRFVHGLRADPCQVADTLIYIFVDNSSTEVTQRSSIAIIADNTAVETPVVTFNAQLGFAPSQIIPVRLAIMF